MKKEIKYNIGLDIGTSSVGWAVIDEDCKIIKKGNKPLWGVRLFEKADNATDRRLKRSTRRRYDRRRERINLLQEEFSKEINLVDSQFYKKMQESFFSQLDEERKTIKLTKEEKDSIIEYNKKYPTIYHLRDELINSSEKMDIRLVYLAIHHIIKYRGNFLHNGDFRVNDLNIKNKLKEVFENINSICDEIDIDNIDEKIYEEIAKILDNPSKNDRKIELNNVLDLYCSKNFKSEFVKLILGNQFSVSKLLNIELEEDISLNFSDTTYEENYDKIENVLGDSTDVIDNLKDLYSMIYLKGLFEDDENCSISSHMVKRYKDHKKDLKEIKLLLKNDKNSYKKIFRYKENDIDLSVYRKYVNNKISYTEFIKEINTEIEKIGLSNDASYLKIKEKMDNDTFLPRITDVNNGKFPYQLNKEELLKIINNQGKYYPFLLDKINDEYKLVKLLSFRIPYYVGPLNDTTDKKGIKNSNAWLIRKIDNVKITPYNFDDVIDKEKTSEEFILRMISNCTYILSAKVIPNNSILYSKFKVLNELKQIKVNGHRISNDVQHYIYENLFLKEGSTITENKFINFISQMNEFDMYSNVENVVEGYSADKKFANNMQSYVDFFGNNGIFKNTNYEIKDAEDIIKWITIFEDKDILENKVRKMYSELSEIAVKSILAKKYSGWSNLSKELLLDVLYKDKVTNNSKSIMDLMWETNENFMQILNNKEYKFEEKINKLNNIENVKEVSYSLVENLTTSPATKKGIYQALKVVEEIVNYIGYNPDNISIEMAREEGEKVRKDNKKDYIKKIYEKHKKDIDEYNSLKKELNGLEKIDNQKYFLYFIQEGKSLYSAKPLDINRINDYEIDHIIPRTLIKDDSLDNKALVLREENQEKAASFVVPEHFRTNSVEWWKKLRDLGLISAKKYNSLIRSKYMEKDIEGFINRQLVETRQITKHVANILKNLYSNTKIIYLHSNLTSNYRKKYELFKYRQLNDYHHAHDAYLAASLGIYKEKYFKVSTDFNKIRELNRRLYDEGKYKELNYGYVINSIDNEFALFDDKTGEIKFDGEEFNKTICDTLYRNDILISKKTEIRTGKFYNENMARKGSNGISLKDNFPTDLYGSYTGVKSSYAVVVKYEEKGKIKQRMIGIPIFIDKQNKKDNKNKYICNLLNINNPDSIEIVRDKIPFYTLLDWDGQICSLVGATNNNVEVCNAKEFNINKDRQIKWKYTLNRLFNKKTNDNLTDEIYNNQLNEIIIYVINKMKSEYKLYSNLIDELKVYFNEDTITTMDMDLKEKSLLELFKLLKYNSENANLKHMKTDKLNPSSAFGKKNSRIISNAIIINKSVTGIKERKNEF